MAIDWNSIGAELDQRAKAFSRKPGPLAAAQSAEGFVTWGKLQQRHSRKFEQISKTDWEWIFTPLVVALLGSGLADWVCLGHFVGSRSEARRRWLYFLSEKASFEHASQRASASSKLRFHRLVLLFSANAECRELAAANLLLTTEILEELDRITLTNPTMDSEYELGLAKPLLLTYQGHASDAEKLHRHARVLDVSRLGRSLRHARRSRYRPSASGLVSIGKALVRHADNEILPFLTCEEGGIRAIAAAYFRSLNDTTGRMVQPRITSADPVVHRLLENWAANDPTALRKIANYLLWLDDISGRAHCVLTIPAWLPAESIEASSGGLVVLFRKQVSADDLLGIANAFRMGCANWVVARGVREGLDLAQSVADHELKQVLLGLWSLVCRFDDFLADGVSGSAPAADKQGTVQWNEGAWLKEYGGIVASRELMRTGLWFLRTWNFEDSRAALPFALNEEPRFADLLERCWRAMITIACVRALALEPPRTIAEFRMSSEEISRLEAAYRSPAVDDSDSLPLAFFSGVVGDRRHRNSYSLTRLLLNLSREQFQHATRHRPSVSLQHLDQGPWRLEWTWDAHSDLQPGERVNSAAASTSFLGRRERTERLTLSGEDLRRALVQSIDPESRVEESHDKGGYSFRAEFLWA